MRTPVPFYLLALVATSISLSACLDHPLKPVELQKASIGDEKIQLYVNKDVDILFVIDNSGSMGEEQANLAGNFGSFIEVLEDPEVEANYRIGVTTTDNGNQWCPAGVYTPEGGKLVLSSCQSRLNDFISPQGDDVQDLACNDICKLDAAQLEISPTTIDGDEVPAPRPWLENIEGRKNIPEGTSTAEAFQCFGPQGVNGCGFESQLESMYLALVRAQSNEEASYGFLRTNAILAVVFVTDEADCSYNKDWSEIFATDGNRVFWSDPDANSPTSALCWNAGVQCSGDPSNYEDCEPVNKDVNGNVGVSDDDAVLHPMSRYVGLVAGIEAEKQLINPEQEVIVGLIGGVSLADNRPHYSDVSDTDPFWQESFGIGPGCEAPNPNNPDEPIRAVPPVRLREMTESFSPGNMFSICNSDYSPALESIANAIREQIRPACYTKCVEDTDEATETLEPECTVEEDPPGSDNTVRIQECRKDANGYVFDPVTGNYEMPADDVNVCYAALTDADDLTSSEGDDMSDECLASNYNLEFKIHRRPGFPAAGGTSISASCSLADFTDVSCPGIGG
jgi:hypothetical protein